MLMCLSNSHSHADVRMLMCLSNSHVQQISKNDLNHAEYDFKMDESQTSSTALGTSFSARQGSQAYRLSMQRGHVGEGKLAGITRFITEMQRMQRMQSETLHPVITSIRCSVDTPFDSIMISHVVEAEVQRGTAPGDIMVVCTHADDTARTLCERLPNSVYVS